MCTRIEATYHSNAQCPSAPLKHARTNRRLGITAIVLVHDPLVGGVTLAQVRRHAVQSNDREIPARGLAAVARVPVACLRG